MTAARERLPRLLATVLPLAGLVLVVSAALIWGTVGFRELPTSFAAGPPAVIAGMLAALGYLGAGWLLASRIPGNPIGWLLLAIGLVFAVMTPTALLVDDAYRAFRPAPPATIAVAWLVSTFSAPIIVGAGIATGLLFPDGRLASGRWRWVLVMSIGGAALLALATAIRPGGQVWYPTLPNPSAMAAGVRPLITVGVTLASMALIAGAVLMVLSLVVRYRRGDATVRAQLRWILYAGVAMAVVVVPTISVRFVVPVGEALGEAMVATADLTLVLVPLAAAVAITRYRLFGIDVIIGRTLVYVPMMAILGGMYTASVAVFQRIFVAVTGTTSDVPLVLTAFLVAAAFTPVRKGLEGMVDRWTHATRPSLTAQRPDDAMDPAVAEVAADVIALRRLEAHLTAAAATSNPSTPRRRLAIDADGRVPCPAGGSPHYRACLGCRHLSALITTPPTVICTPDMAGNDGRV